MLFPILLVVMLGGLIANFGQAGFLISSKALQPKLSKISPLKGLKRIFSMRSIVELIKGILKILIVGGIAYTVILSTVNSLDNLILLLPQSIVSFFGEVMLKITLRIVVFLSFVAIADYAWQRYDHQKKLMMTKQEIKDEQKRYEGNPEGKSFWEGEMARSPRPLSPGRARWAGGAPQPPQGSRKSKKSKKSNKIH